MRSLPNPDFLAQRAEVQSPKFLYIGCGAFGTGIDPKDLGRLQGWLLKIQDLSRLPPTEREDRLTPDGSAW